MNKRDIFILLGIPIMFILLTDLKNNLNPGLSNFRFLGYMYLGAWLLEFNYLLGFIKPYQNKN